MAHPECCTATTLLIGQRLRLPVLGHGMRERARVLAVRVACIVSGVRVWVRGCVACVSGVRDVHACSVGGRALHHVDPTRICR
jgi:hypothetical protein